MTSRSVSKTVVKRLPVYLRILDNLIRRDVEIVSSRELSLESGFSAEQIRKDLAYFGAFGTRGTGYNTTFLRDKLLKIIGLDQKTKIIIIGAGHLGTALARYNAVNNPYVDIVAIFDRDRRVIGQKIEQIRVLPFQQAPEIIRRYHIKVALITVPAGSAQQVVDEIIKHGVTAILNFAPAKLHAPEGVHIHNSDLTIDLQSLIYYSTAEEERLLRLQQETEETKSQKMLKLE
ncbi:MAG: redox-sensing transcriptional repressor Rex [Dethiobacteria bacterium]|jgi:redox-sensing transcriptional repressor|nr:redox-sensing transcriptional repressor Rex [Bacillota bacterium]NMD32581.1 redox-sensing transcriptional repressor Rex [Bacillota bacterium]HOB28789.1 redox-sensing transcriptional repressor Rex [Bacillota bacterium]HPZ41741.1 redox-sensing transcriptional repressor Rex [Bacillota bacterium]HQD52534.1 redox-sensing transcriptional repressor Rex [Bacillota bacterium]